jgi:hypothetical protein
MPLSFFNFGLFSVIISLNKHAVTFFFFFFLSDWGLNSELVLAKQVLTKQALYHLSHTSHFFLLNSYDVCQLF